MIRLATTGACIVLNDMSSGWFSVYAGTEGTRFRRAMRMAYHAGQSDSEWETDSDDGNDYDVGSYTDTTSAPGARRGIRCGNTLERISHNLCRASQSCNYVNDPRRLCLVRASVAPPWCRRP